MDNKILIEQSQHWEKSFSSKPEMFGSEPSHSAKIALEKFKKNNVKHIIELGAGLGRDTIFFAKNSIKVTALDYSPTAVEIIKKKSDSLGLSDFIDAQTHDLRQKLNFKDDSFEGCYSHMLYCMAFTEIELEKLNNDISHKLKKGWGVTYSTGLTHQVKKVTSGKRYACVFWTTSPVSYTHLTLPTSDLV